MIIGGIDPVFLTLIFRKLEVIWKGMDLERTIIREKQKGKLRTRKKET